jgi:replicative DNA helicase
VAIHRAPDAPPVDSAAEAALLNMLLLHPDMVGSVDLGPLLWCPEHKAVWRAMAHVHMRAPGRNLAEWWIAIRRELHADACRGESLVTHYVATDGGWQWRCAGWRYWNVLNEAELPSRYDYQPYARRLEQCAEARRIISAAQEIASRAWRVPEQSFSGAEAVAILELAAPVAVRQPAYAASSVNIDDLEV